MITVSGACEIGGFSLAPTTDGPVAESPAVPSHSLNHRGESFSSGSLVPLTDRSIKRDSPLESVGLTSKEEPKASADGSKKPTSWSTFWVVLLGNAVAEYLAVIFKLSASSSSEKLAMPPFPSVAPSLVVGTSVCVVGAWVKITTEGEVEASVRGEVGGVTAVEVKGTAAVVGGRGSVGEGWVVVVAAARTVGKGFRFRAGGGTVGVGGLNLTMEKHKCTKPGRDGRGTGGGRGENSRGRQN